MSVWTPVEPLRSRSWRSWGLDALVVLGAGAFATSYVFNVAPVPTSVEVTLLAAMVLPLAVRRIWPVPVFAWDFAVAAGTGWWAMQIVWSPALVIALYTVAALRPRREAALATGALACGVVAGTAHVLSGYGSWLPASASLLAVVLAAVVLGLYMATRRALLTELQDRAAQLERDLDQQSALAAAAERARIAREMHDIVAHHLTVMVALSDGAAAQARSAPEQACDAMRSVSATGREALSDTRRLLGVLREERDAGAVRSPLPALEDLDGLLERVRTAGLPVRCEVLGTAPEMHAGIQLTIYRLVQEALTNTMKHAGNGASARVRIGYSAAAIDVEIEDDGTADVAAALRPGRGLAGMHERLAAFGGTVEARPRRPHGWLVRARVPLAEGAAP